MDIVSKISKLKESAISDLDSIRNIDKNVNGIFLFFSIDLVNSTKFKSMFPNNWPSILESFYIMGQKSVESGWEIWKYIGDEILMYKYVNSIEDVLNSIEDVNLMSKYIINDLHSTYCFTKGNLDYKSSLWLAHVKTYNSSSDSNYDKLDMNYYPYSYIISTMKQIDDFIGPDIDEGFRLSKYSAAKTIIIDPKIAYLIWKNKNDINIFKNIKIVDIQKLKGVNFNRQTPIIWYREDWDDINLLGIGDTYSDKILNRIANRTYSLPNSKKSICKIEDYIYNMGLQYRLDEITNRINGKEENYTKQDFLRASNFGEPYDTFELHLAVICFKKNTDEVLIFKRNKDKLIKESKWEFGCTKLLDNGLSIIEQVKKDYKSDFNIDIDVILNESTGNPEIIGTYTLQKFSKTVIGIVLVAEFENEDIELKDYKHEEYKLLSVDKLSTINYNEKVTNFDNHINIAKKIIDDKKVSDKN